MLKKTTTSTIFTIDEANARDRVILATRSFEKVQYLFEEGSATEEELDKAEAELKEAKKELASCR